MGTPRSAMVLPLAYAKGERLLGFLVIGLSPRPPLAGEYRGFLELAAGAVTTAVSSAQAQQETRKRVEKLDAIDRAKTAFFSNVSHEFRTPLTLMLGPTENALAERIVDAHGGRIDVVSTPEDGTRFTVRLPRRVNAER